MNLTLSFLFFFSLILVSCKSRIDQKDFTVVDILNGNTLRLKNGLQVQLLGIYPSRNSFNYLTKYTLNKKIRIRFDSKLDNDKNLKEKKVYAYLLDDKNNCINSILLIGSYSALNTSYLNDSLFSFSGYTQLTVDDEKNKNDTFPDNRIKDIMSIVKEVEPSIFKVISTDLNNNPVSQGTGFFIGRNNLAVSNHHVFAFGKKWFIKYSDGATYSVNKIIRQSKNFDFVLFQVNSAKSFPFLKTASKLPAKGEDILVIGNPQGLENTVTRGIVSSIRSSVTQNDLIQIDAAISPGSSGSPVFNLLGEVVGIATMKIEDCENCNFAFSIKVLNL